MPGTILGAGKFSHEWRLVPTVMKLTFRSGQYTFWNEGRGKKMLLSESAIQFQKRSERRIGQGELLSKDVVLAGDQLEMVWFPWKLRSVNFTPVPQFVQCQHGCHP